ncbi:metaxin-2-like [Rhopilema esculentum]|uniref:metaxin-2-like n=1 Tax=Rhopilema esculentum TaxID=499914 RepID=UPI0031E26385
MSSSSLLSQAFIATSKGDNASEWPEDAQIYQPLLGQMTLPEQAKCYGIEALLRLQNLKYDLVMRSNAEYISPSGKVPLLRIDDEVVSEESILSWLQKKGFSLMNQLPDSQKLQVKALISLFETVLVPAELYCTWLDTGNTKETKATYGSVYPQPLKYLLTHKKEAAVKSLLKARGWDKKTKEDVEKELITVLSVASVKLDQNVFLTGDHATEADAILFGHLQAILATKQSSKLLVHALEDFPQLVRYCVTIGKLCGFAS